MRKVVLGLVLVAMLTGCSSGGSGGDPIGAVNNVINAFKAKNFAGIPAMICASKRDEVAAKVNPAIALASSAPGVNADQIIAAMSIDVQNFAATVASQTDAAAVVNVTGTLAISLDPTKSRDFVKSILTGAGQPTDDANVDHYVTLVTSGAARSNDISGPVNVVKENGAWLVCDDLGFGG